MRLAIETTAKKTETVARLKPVFAFISYSPIAVGFSGPGRNASIHALGEIAEELLAPLAHAFCARMNADEGFRVGIVNPPVGMRC